MASVTDPLGLTSGRRYRLAPTPFDAGGGGSVSRVEGDPAVVAKLFPATVPLDSPLGRRLQAVLAKKLTSPHLARLVDLLVDPSDPDILVGFVMGRVVGHTLYSVTNPDERKLLGLALSPLDRLLLALETARAFEAIHGLHIRLADAHHRNAMATFDRRGRVAGVVLIEPDTWIFEWRTNGRLERFTSLARPDFLPPEFQTADLSVTPLTFESDRFALALLVSLALFDCTPFAFAGSTAPVERRIAAGHEWVTPNLPRGATAPDRLPIDPAAVPADVLDLIRRGTSPTPAARPAAGEWVGPLSAWHQGAIDRSAAGRFVAALTGLRAARSLADLTARFAAVLFAALRRFVPAVADRSAAWWVWLGVKAATVLLAVLALGWWAGTAVTTPATDEKPPKSTSASPVPPLPSGPRVSWRALVDPADPEE